MSRVSDVPRELLAGTLCSLCGEARAVAMWSGAEELRVCPSCAMRVLPALLADAVQISRSPVELIQQIEARFYACLAFRHWRERFRS